MAQKYVIQLLTATTAEWNKSDYVIPRGELVAEYLEDGTIQLKVGNGLRKFSDLPYLADKGPKGDAFTYADFTHEQLTELKGEKGDTGETGKGLDILGTYTTVESLTTSVKSPTQGDMYNVGSFAPYTIYMYDTVLGWVSQGQLQGEKGTTFIPSVNANGDLTWTNDGGLVNPAIVNIRGEKGDKGPKGDIGPTGKGLDILGIYATENELKTSVISPEQGDMYNVGTFAPYTIYMYDSVLGWVSQGQLQGESGVTFTPYIDSDGNLTWTNDGGLTNPSSVNIRGEKGDKGDTGDPGLQGIPGERGEPGEKGEKGDAFTYADFTPEQLSGLKGDKGDKGDTGDTGAAGAVGPAPTLTIGTVSNGSSASATITGSSGSYKLNLVLPKGDKGDTGTTGATGPAPTLIIGTVSRGTSASATITGSSGSYKLNLTLPKGDTGATGATGPQGPSGYNGTTPVRGVDYWTSSDKNEIINSVLSALPAAEDYNY